MCDLPFQSNPAAFMHGRNKNRLATAITAAGVVRSGIQRKILADDNKRRDQGGKQRIVEQVPKP